MRAASARLSSMGSPDAATGAARGSKRAIRTRTPSRRRCRGVIGKPHYLRGRFSGTLTVACLRRKDGRRGTFRLDGRNEGRARLPGRGGGSRRRGLGGADPAGGRELHVIGGAGPGLPLMGLG